VISRQYLRALSQVLAAVPKAFEITLRGKYAVTGFLRECNDSVVSISVQPSSMGSVAYLEMTLYGLADERAKGVENEWRSWLAQLFPATAAAPAN